MKILLNSDLGEAKSFENASELLRCVDLVNIGGNFGEGNEATLRQYVRLARERLMQVGALAGPADGVDAGSGTRKFGPREVVSFLEEAASSLQRAADGEAGLVGHVKLRGVLREACDERTDLAEACVDWMEAELEGIPLIVGAGGLLHAVAEARGVPLLREICAGRGYADEARFIPRGEAGALIEDPDEAAQRISAWRATGYLSAGGGKQWLVEAETVCVPADSPRSVEIARAVRGALALQ